MRDLTKLAKLHSDVIGGKVTIEEYRKEELKMIKKYGLKIKGEI
jgi:cystathionine beta-lyase/cystathionine gamma-synthase